MTFEVGGQMVARSVKADLRLQQLKVVVNFVSMVETVGFEVCLSSNC